METAIVSVICIGLILFGGMTMSQGFLNSVDTTSASLEEMGQYDENIMRTELSVDDVTMIGLNQIRLDLENTGQTKLAEFDKWDVIVQYYDSGSNYYSKWLPYTDNTLDDDEWEKTSITMGGAAETFEPGILNPGELLRITAQVSPSANSSFDKMITVCTKNGINSSVSFR